MNKTPATAKLSDALAVKPGVLEVLDLIRQVAPVPQQFGAFPQFVTLRFVSASAVSCSRGPSSRNKTYSHEMISCSPR